MAMKDLTEQDKPTLLQLLDHAEQSLRRSIGMQKLPIVKKAFESLLDDVTKLRVKIG